MSDALHERLRSAAGQRTYRRIGELTQTHPETVRRYMAGQSPSIEFVASFCTSFGISGEWMLTGNGPMRVTQTKTDALKEADAGELLSAMAGTIETMSARLERLEVYVQVLEARLRGEELAVDGSGRIGGPSDPEPRALGIGRAVAGA